MGIYINGMEMPKERESFTVTIKYNGLVFDTETMIQVAEAQEVPPHGKLIDADALLKEHYIGTEDGEYIKCASVITPLLVSKLPTIIEAEEGET